MTRINLVSPKYLADQHCFAEWREIKMIPKSLRRSLDASHSSNHLLQKIPRAFTLNKGHVMFFYDKGAYLQERYVLLTESLLRRKYDIDPSAELDPDGIFRALPARFWQEYVPTPDAYKIIKARLRESFLKQPWWYRFSDIGDSEDDADGLFQKNIADIYSKRALEQLGIPAHNPQ